MLKERLQEILDFSKSESPYRKANKGWINQDIYLDLTPSSNTVVQKNEAATVTLLWAPLNNLISKIFLIIIIGCIIVFTSVSFVKGRFDFVVFNSSMNTDIVKIEENNVLITDDLDDDQSMNSTFDINLDLNKIDQTQQIQSSEVFGLKVAQESIDNKIANIVPKTKDIDAKKEIKISNNKKSKSNFF